MKDILKRIEDVRISGERILAVLIDPEKFDLSEAGDFLRKIPRATSLIFVGGSSDSEQKTKNCISGIKAETAMPVVIFPGDYTQISESADAILFLSLLSGRNPEYLIGQQIKAVPHLRKTNLEIIPTGYILIDGGRECAVQRISGTEPLSRHEPDVIVDTAVAGVYSGKKIIYLEAGSGAKHPVCSEIILAVRNAVSVPLIVGGGIRSLKQLEAAFDAGADIVVVGTAFEKGDFFTV